MLNKLTTGTFIAMGFLLASMQLYVLATLMAVCAVFNHERMLFE